MKANQFKSVQVRASQFKSKKRTKAVKKNSTQLLRPQTRIQNVAFGVFQSNQKKSITISMENHSIVWLIPEETNKSQCLHILLLKKTKEVVEVIVSEYQCIFGHRMSRLLLQLYQSSQRREGGEENCILELVEDNEVDILPALFYIHSESLKNVFSDCSALTLAKTAHYLQMDHLSRYIIEEASITLSYSLNLSQENGLLRISIWDAIAILHLLGDVHNLLSYINTQYWCERLVSSLSLFVHSLFHYLIVC